MSFSTLKYDGIYDFKHFLQKQLFCIFQNVDFSFFGFFAWGIFYWPKSIDIFCQNPLISISVSKFFNKMAKT